MCIFNVKTMIIITLCYNLAMAVPGIVCSHIFENFL